VSETSRPPGGPPRPLLTITEVRNVLARVVAAGEELPYEPGQAAAILGDLEADVAALIEGAAP